MMTPQEVANCTFAKSVMGGYNMASVDDFLDKLTEDYAALYKENTALKAKLKMTVDKMAEYRESEDAIRSTLLAAQKMSTSMLTEAEDKELEAERRRLSVGQEQLRAFIRDVRAVCNEELAQLELLPELPAEEPKPKPVIQVIPPAAEKEEDPPPVALTEGEEVSLSHDQLVQAISAFAPAPVENNSSALEEPEVEEGDGADDPFDSGELEDEDATRIMNLDDLQFGPNYTKD